MVISANGPEQSEINDSGIKAQLYSSASFDSGWRLIGEYTWVRRAGPGRHAQAGAIAGAIAPASPSIANDPYANLSPFDGFQDSDTLSLTYRYEHQLGKLDVSFRPNNSKWQLGVWLDNVWDETYFIHGFLVLGGGIGTAAPELSAGVKSIVHF